MAVGQIRQQEDSLYGFMEHLSACLALQFPPNHMVMIISTMLLVISWVWPSLATQTSYIIYIWWCLWSLSPAFDILSKTSSGSLALRRAIWIKTVLAILLWINKVFTVGDIFGHGWFFLVPCLCSIKVDQRGLTTGDWLLIGFENFLPEVWFPTMRETKALPGLDSTVEGFLPGLHESVHAMRPALPRNLRIEAIWLIAVIGSAVLQYLGYDGVGFVVNGIHIFKLWYTIRAVLPCSARAFAPIRTVLRNLFCFWTLCEMTALLCKIPFVTSLVLKHANISAVVSGLVMVVLLTGYDRSGDGASYRLLVALLRPIM